jgi:L,D-transpeptidase catalytic domain
MPLNVCTRDRGCAPVVLTVLSVAALIAAFVMTPAVSATPVVPSPTPLSAPVADEAGWPAFADTSLDREVLDLALGAAACATRAGLVAHPSTLTVIDYSRPSTERRLWVYDLTTGEALFHELVAHGQGSGENVPSLFSNVPNSHQSSLGLFVTAESYVGLNGYSLRLDGLDPGVNDRARERAIVMHGAPYVSESVAAAQGRLGRSWGCPALGETVAREVIDRIKGGNLIFAYYPDRAWLNGSPLLGDCAAARG